MAESEDFREVELTAERRGKPQKLLKVCVSLGFPNHLEKLMRTIHQELRGSIKELEDRIQLSLQSQLLGYFMSKSHHFWSLFDESHGDCSITLSFLEFKLRLLEMQDLLIELDRDTDYSAPLPGYQTLLNILYKYLQKLCNELHALPKNRLWAAMSKTFVFDPSSTPPRAMIPKELQYDDKKLDGLLLLLHYCHKYHKTIHKKGRLSPFLIGPENEGTEQDLQDLLQKIDLVPFFASLIPHVSHIRSFDCCVSDITEYLSIDFIISTHGDYVWPIRPSSRRRHPPHMQNTIIT
jgi:hypothetical protein